ncbi:hypothetical protein [Hymenobacter jeollabukensis]|uniref:Uncharacterized protein n=1 Tax=Hymenobacter jeollabukensis TaxID=2025313 RepID=A0A5R8WTH7_9BACT|nr:hypothetical protein [Hymenobacter jeollabukensis]TLM95071.1 hypothetical protein FDY95_04535 [Hymenobacter jeollabukensis]
MRQIARVPQPASHVVRLMIHDCDDGVYLFGFDTLTDGRGLWDQRHETVAAAEAAAQREYGVAPGSWQPIADLQAHCQQDWIAPVRTKGSPEGQPQYGRLETLVNNEWVDFHPEQF